MQRTFQDTSRLGEAGKRLVMSHLQKCGYQVQDLTAQREYTSRFIDFSLSDGNQMRYVCVRTDARLCTTNNIVLETLMCRRNTHHLVPGWFFTCQAELLAYLDAYGGRLYIMDWGYLKELANHSQIGYRKNFWNPVDHNSIGQIHIIPIKDLVKCPAFKGTMQLNVYELRQYNWQKPAPF